MLEQNLELGILATSTVKSNLKSLYAKLNTI